MNKEIKEILNNYELGELLSCEKMICGYSNTNYKIDTSTGSYLYRICQRQSLDSIQYEMNLMQALKQIRFPAAFPIQRKDKEYISLGNHHWVTIYEFIEGTQPKVTPKTVEEIALTTGQLSQFKNWRQLPRKNPISLDICHKLIKDFETSKYQYSNIFSYFIEQTEYLNSYLTQKIPKGMVHGDLFPDNTIFNGNKLTAIIDFEFSCPDYLLIDVGVAINGFCFLNNRLNRDLLIIFLENYSKIRRLTPKEIALLPYYIQWGGHGIISCHLEHNLLSQRSIKQLNRVNELMERVKILRQEEVIISRLIQDFARSQPHFP
ncbi:MAG: homoserine kinase [Symploca sp. SIO2D2]|nr:homoserine kinase [Symploca sp. SIO2D2]